MKTKAEQLFFKGDVVQVVAKPYIKCPYLWTPEMSKFCGKNVTIRDARYQKQNDRWVYHLKEDVHCFSWCENCFESPYPDIEESELSVDVLFGGYLS